MELKLPELGEGVHEGELVRWLIKPGDKVKDDQPLCEIMTDKATVEFPSPFYGTITALHAKEGEVIKVGQVIISYEGSARSVEKAEPQATNVVSAIAPMSTPKPKPAPASDPEPKPQNLAPNFGSEPPAAPSARRLAREMGVDLASVSGSGPRGRVLRDDIERFAGAPKRPMVLSPQPVTLQGGEERVPFRGLRKKISERMRLSKDKAAHFTYVEEADATELVNLRNQAKEIGAQYGVKVTYMPFIMKAMVAALRRYPILNSYLDEEKGELVYKHYFNISVSVQTEDGLIAPVIKNVEGKSILELARDIQAVAERARAKRLSLEDLSGGTITLTNAGSIGGLFATPIINYPEVAILGFNKIFRKPVVKTVNGHEEIVVRDWTYFSISLDHRVVDGAIGAEFMKLFVKYIETPALLMF